MKTLNTLAAGLVLGGLLMVTSAKASLTTIGSTQTGNSWYQQFNDTAASFNNIDVSWVSGTMFEPPALRNFLDASWSAAAGTGITDNASGNATTSLTFDVWWVNTSAAPTTFDFYAYNGNALVDSARAMWTGSTWEIGAIPVPETTTVIAAALLLLPLGASSLRILRRNRMA